MASTIAHAELPVPVPETTPAALVRIRDGNIQWVAFRLLDLAIPLLILFTGLGARLRRMCGSISGHRWFGTVTLFACAYLALAGLIALPFDFSAGYVWTHAAGWSHQTLQDWLKDEGVQIAVKAVVAALLIWLPYKLIARSPRRCWLYSTLALFPFAFLALIALPVWVKPLTTNYKPLEDGPLKTRIETMAARCGVTNIPVLVGGNSTGVDADALIFVRDAQTELAPEWGTFFLIFRADHPPIRERIEFANNYKPWEHGAPLRYSNVCKSE